jgi:hypothetical protein
MGKESITTNIQEGVSAKEVEKQGVKTKGFAQIQLDNINERLKEPQIASERKHLLELKLIWEKKANESTKGN